MSADAGDVLHGFRSREAYCGSRTQQCPICSLSVPLKKMVFHSQVSHGGAAIDLLAGSPAKLRRRDESLTTRKALRS